MFSFGRRLISYFQVFPTDDFVPVLSERVTAPLPPPQKKNLKNATLLERLIGRVWDRFASAQTEQTVVDRRDDK